MTNPKQLANIIADQLGGTARLKIMLGAHDFQAVYAEQGSGLQFSFPRKKAEKYGYVNRCRILLAVDDTYVFELWYIDKLGATKRYMLADVYCDMLINLFEVTTGLYLAL